MCLKIIRIEECRGIGDQKKETGWEISGQKFICNSPFENNFHLQASRLKVRINVVKGPTLIKDINMKNEI